MNLWLNYLKYKIFSDIEELIKLLKIDKAISGTEYDINKLIDFIIPNMGKNILLVNNNIDITDYLIEENPETLIRVINDNYNKKCTVTILENNVGINSWIIKKYEEFCSENNIEKNIHFNISNHFAYSEGKLMMLGSKAFINEINETLTIPYIASIDD